MKTVTIAASLALLAGLAPASRAIELSLEENRAERGSIGYIDMQRLFKQFPDTIRAKENFEEVVRQAEEQVNMRKVEIIRLRNELSQMRIERQFMAQMQAPVEVAKADAPKVATSSPSATASPATISSTTALSQGGKPETAKTVAALPGFGESPLPGFGGSPVSVATAAASAPSKPADEKKPEPLVINIPGVSTAPIVVQPPASTIVAVVASTKPAAAEPSAIKPAASAAPAVPPALAELDGKIALKEKDLAQREADFKEYQASSEKNLLDLESRKTEILLGKIHRAVQDVARKEGVSVVVDKSSILYGHDAVDLTEKVLKYLRGS